MRRVISIGILVHVCRWAVGVDHFVLGHSISVSAELLFENLLCIFMYLFAFIALLDCSVFVRTFAFLYEVVGPNGRALISSMLGGEGPFVILAQRLLSVEGRLVLAVEPFVPLLN